MASIAFDTHAAANRFKRAGFTEDQIEALVEITRETTALPDVSTLATKADITRLEAKIDTEIAQLGTRIDRQIGGLDAKIGGLDAKIDKQIGGLEAKIGGLGANIDKQIGALNAKIDMEIAGVGAKIASAQVQALTIIISSMALIVTLATVLSRLIH